MQIVWTVRTRHGVGGAVPLYSNKHSLQCTPSALSDTALSAFHEEKKNQQCRELNSFHLHLAIPFVYMATFYMIFAEP